jgi:1,4-dihydroxy-6-naphthoate synthase
MEANGGPAADAVREISVGHSPDSDDAFMFYGLATSKVRVPGLKFVHQLNDIETLNRKAAEDGGQYDVTAISFHAYPYVQQHYALLSCGGSVGEGFGPVVVASRPAQPAEIGDLTIAVPGTMTTAYLALRLFAPEVKTVAMLFDEIIPSVVEGRCDAGLIIHKGNLTYSQQGLFRVVDLGRWWQETQHLPLPLMGIAVRRSLDPEVSAQVAGAVQASIRFALEHREEAMAYALQFSRAVDAQLAEQFVAMWVNERALDYGEAGREAVQRMLRLGYESGVIPHAAEVEFISPK